MGRPPLALGTAGKFRYYGTGKAWRCRCSFRDYDGVTREVERSGTSKAGAERTLKEALRDRVHVDPAAEVSSATKVSVVCEAWWSVFVETSKSPGTKQIYRGRLDNQIIPSLGNLRIRELSTGIVERFLRAVETGHGSALAKTTRTVLSNVCGYACRHDALDRNPVRETSPISVKPKKGAPKALTVEELRLLRTCLTYDDTAIRRDLVDLVGLMAATGLRLGEALALVWDAIDLEAGTVEVRGTVVRIKGQGLVIKPEPKSEAGFRILMLPVWCIEVLRRRPRTMDKQGLGVIFLSRTKTLRDPANVDDMLKDAFTNAGFEDITSHIFRKTVATLMDDAGLSARAGADQLGHAKVSMTQNVYFGRKVRDTGAAAVLEAIGA